MDENNNTHGYNYDRITDRSMDELIGICRGILFDGSISLDEVINVHKWMLANNATARHAMGNTLFNLLDNIVQSGMFTDNDELAVINQIVALTGAAEINAEGSNASTTLPLCENPLTEIVINGSHFALTGNFTKAKRKDVEKLITDNGGKIKKNANSNCDYLVIGETGSGAWAHSSFGRKIEEAVKTRSDGGVIAIVSEAHFFETAVVYEQ